MKATITCKFMAYKVTWRLAGLNKTNKGLVPLYHLKPGDKYKIMDSQCYAQVVKIEELEWHHTTAQYIPVSTSLRKP